MSLSIEDWHRRFARQARWTKALRDYLFRESGLDQSGRILEAGSGTGVLLAELGSTRAVHVHGLDIDLERLRFSARTASGAKLTCGDAQRLPYSTNSMDSSFCHYLLLWVSQPEQVLSELVRVTRLGGPVLVLAEPDYGGRIDHPSELEQLGGWQTAALRKQGADPHIGRQLAGFLARSGLVSIVSGILGGERTAPPEEKELLSEWSVYESDFEYLDLSPAELARLRRLKEVDRLAWESGERAMFVPTFFAWGRVPGD